MPFMIIFTFIFATNYQSTKVPNYKSNATIFYVQLPPESGRRLPSSQELPCNCNNANAATATFIAYRL